MFIHVSFGQLYADSEYANCEYNAGNFESDFICCLFGMATPIAGVKNICAIGADDHTE